ncbi:hypothetical protein N7468_000887 [Penicillium chermesinum]|uniref:PLC-like phosphodiesterase n=1 Tax=Penicillium chermesinum TaxID=63820 RepID=A0A9W9TY41_9EURO|nr:uncharacterized protein N7468_000887 [Penicillium chermesinum]KAJ5245904.1 hypothetical protein N7468_000887 [Penicillium chermesinum]KAJ6144201.1 hypothetical protein N7470_008096 [Penicillium chermesinum]
MTFANQGWTRALLGALGFLSATNVLGQDTCNGRSEYCTRSYSNITFVGSHDSAFVGDLPTQNQNLNVTAQLDLGIRYLQAQTHKSIGDDSVLELCHTSCLLEDAGPLSDFLGTVKSWLDGNPDEVVTLLLTNGDSVDISVFGDTFSGVDGLVNYIYVPSSQPLAIGDWPTLGDLISAGTRLIVFLDYGANTDTVNYINDEFSYYFETPYDVTDSSFSNCSIDRPPGASAEGRMYIVNHFLDVDILGVDVPDRDAAGTTNAATGDGSIGAQADECEALYKVNPNVLLLDFVDQGDPLGAQTSLNGLS